MDSPERSGETERSWATILFADVTDSTGLVERTGDETAYTILTECMELLARVARSHGAAHVLERGDGVLVVFGAPRALEQAARAAVNAAIEMRSSVREFVAARCPARPIEIHAGINTGSVLAGGLDVGAAPQLALVGDAVNIAARLASQAPAGAVLVGPDTHRATREEFEYRALPPVSLKGKSEPLPCFQLVSTKTRRYRPRPGSGRLRSELVGRARELGVLREALGRAGSVVTLEAEPGLGKSRLLTELARTPEAGRLTWLEGRSLSTGAHLRHHPFVDMLGTFADLDDESSATRDRFEEQLAGRLAGSAQELAPFLAALLHVPLTSEERELLELTQGEARELRTRRAVEQLLQEIATARPLALVFDDLHWADSSSIELLESLLRSPLLANPVFVLAFRPGYTATSERILATLAREHGGRWTPLALEPLGRRDASRIVDNLLGGADLPEPVRVEILDKAGGNPFFAEEIAQSLIEAGALGERDGRLVATERIHATPIPGSVQEVVMARLDRLPVEDRQLVEVAAAIGPTFAQPILAHVAGKEGLETRLAELVDAALIVPAPARGGHAKYRFRHPVVQEVTYARLLAASRVALHGKIAAAIELLLTENAPGYFALLAYHYGLADDSERAEQYLFRAGEEAARAAASSEALYFFREAASLFFRTRGATGNAESKARLEKNVAMAYFHRGELAKATEHFGSALGHLGDSVSRAGAGAWIAFGVDLAAVAIGLRFSLWQPRRPATSAQREVLDIRFRRGLSQTTSSPEFAFDTIATLRRLARVDPNSIPEAGGIYAGAIGVFSYGGVSFDLGRRILERADAVVESGGVRELYLYYRLMKYLHFHLAGDWSDAHRIEDAVVAEAERFGRLWEIQTYWDFEIERATYRAEWDLVAARLDALESLATRYEHRVASGARLYRGAMLHLERGALSQALEDLELYCNEYREPSFLLVGLGSIAKAQILAGDLAAARITLARAAAIRASAGMVSPFHQSRVIASELAWGVASWDAARRADGGPARIARRDVWRARWVASRVAAFRPEVERLLGAREWLGGRPNAALRAFQRSLAAARSLGMDAEEAHTHLEIARRMSEKPGRSQLEGMDADGHRAAASRLFAERGLEAWCDRCEP